MYSTRQVAALFDLPETQIRQYARDGVLEPERTTRGAFRFDFRDLIVLRAATELTSSNVSHARVRRAFNHIRDQLGDERELTEIRLVNNGRSLVASDGETSWEPESGQVQLALDDPTQSSPVACLEPTSTTGRSAAESSPIPTEEILEADIWFDVARELEQAMPLEAEHAYERALISNPYHVEASINLGRLLHIRGRIDDAIRQYRRAIDIDGSASVAAFNLGVALEERGEIDEAIEAYALAVAAQPELADAHYNLGRLYDRLGEDRAAIRHWSAYKRLVGSRGV